MIKKRELFGFAAIVTAIVVIAIIGIGVTSCSEGPMGPEGPQGPAGSTGSDGSDGSSGSDGRPAIPVVVYTITFDSGEEGSAVDPQKVMKDDKAHIPENAFRPFTLEQIFVEGAGLYRTGAGSGWILTGWFLEDGSLYDFDSAVTSDIHLTARWAMPGKISTGSDGIDAVPADANFFDNALAFVVDNPSGYYLVLDDDYTAQTTKTATATGISLTIVGLGSERTITSNTTTGQLFVINNGAQLYLESNITLKGKVTNSTQPLINVTSGSLTMQDGSKITGFTTSTSNMQTINLTGGTARFVMNGGEISGNQSTASGANTGIVCTRLSSLFTMNGGTITGNTANNCINVIGSTGSPSEGIFNMNGGTITGNTGIGVIARSYCNGGYCFKMTGGSITGNTHEMGDVYKSTVNGGFTPNNVPYNAAVSLEGTAVIGTLTTVQHSVATTETDSYQRAFPQIRISGKWEGSVQTLNLYSSVTPNTTFANVYGQYVNKYLVVNEPPYVLTSADIDNFKQINFMRADFQVQNIANTIYALVRAGADMGKIK